MQVRWWLLIALMWSPQGCHEPKAAAPGEVRPRDVEVVQVVARDLPVEFEAVGRTESSQRVEIRARVAGFLDQIVYDEGAFVESGDVLFRIDAAPFESKLRAARAELAQQQARLENAEALLARIKPLAEAQAVAEKELDDAQGRVREAAAAVEAASAHVFDAELNLGYATIHSPVRGMTGEARERDGAYISGTSGPLTYVARIDPMWVEFSVTETQILRAMRNEEERAIEYPKEGRFVVEVELADGSRHPHTGHISFTDATVSTSTGTLLVRAEIPNPDRELLPGQYVRVYLQGARRPGATLIPQRAVRESPKGPYVWVIDRDGHAERRPVTLGPWYADAWVIESGVGEGDRVVVNGTVGLQPGIPLSVARIVDPAAVNEGETR